MSFQHEFVDFGSVLTDSVWGEKEIPTNTINKDDKRSPWASMYVLQHSPGVVTICIALAFDWDQNKVCLSFIDVVDNSSDMILIFKLYALSLLTWHFSSLVVLPEP